MKIVKIALISLLAVLGNAAYASSSLYSEKVTIQTLAETDTFKVYGNCGMCKATIEGALKDVKGIEKAEWDIEAKMMYVTYDKKLISLDGIKKKIAAVGYDTDKFRASDETYGELPGCCQYERPENETKNK
jgi:copper chaperone CopZ